MKAVAVSAKSHSISIVDAPEPTLEEPGQLLVETLRVGLCGTDREIIEQGYGEPPEGEDYLILGHECLGRVIDAGDSSMNFKAGQLVVPRVRRPCDATTCRACRSGRPDFCLTGQFTERGIKGRHGFLCERFVDDEQYFHAVPVELGMLGVLTEPLTIAVKAMFQIRDVQDRLPYVNREKLQRGELEQTTSVVLGAGPVGLLGALALLNANSRVFVYSRVEEPNTAAQLIEKAGGEYVSSLSVDADQFREMTGPVDIIYEATGASQFAFDMTRLLGRNGIYVFTGVPGRKGPVEIHADSIMMNMVLQNQLFVGTVNAGPPAFEESISLLTQIHHRWPTILEQMITREILPEDVETAMSKPKDGIKTVVRFK